MPHLDRTYSGCRNPWRPGSWSSAPYAQRPGPSPEHRPIRTALARSGFLQCSLRLRVERSGRGQGVGGTHLPHPLGAVMRRRRGRGRSPMRGVCTGLTPVDWASWSNRNTPSGLSIGRRGPRLPRWWNATTASSEAAGAWGSTLRVVGRKAHARPQPRTEARSCSGRYGPRGACLRRGRLRWAGASSVPPTRCPGSRAARRTRQGRTTWPDWRIACCYVGKGRRRQGVATAALAGALDLIAGLGGGTVEGYPEDAELGARRLPLQRCAIDLRAARVHPRPKDRQAPLGRDQDRRAGVLSWSGGTWPVGKEDRPARRHRDFDANRLLASFGGSTNPWRPNASATCLSSWAW